MSDRATIVVGARVRTMDPALRVADAIGVADGAFTVVGTREDVLAWAPAGVEVIDVGGAAILPGLLDAHVHHNLAGEAELRELRVASTDSVDGIIAAVADRVASTEDRWIAGGNWGSKPVRHRAGGPPARPSSADVVRRRTGVRRRRSLPFVIDHEVSSVHPHVPIG